MRRAAAVLGPFTLLAGAVFACEDDPTNIGGPSFGLDGSTPEFDAGQQPFDSGSPDTTPPGPPKVTVSISTPTGPRANVLVVFHDAAGAVLETKTTGADGKASSTGALPSMASALLSSEFERGIVTWTGLENGDELVLRDSDPSENRIGRVNVTLGSAFDGASQYDLSASGCGGNIDQGTTGEINLYSTCARSPSAVLATALTPNRQVLAHAFKKNNALVTDGGGVDVTTGAWKAPGNLTINISNIPDQTYAGAELLEIADGHGYRNNGDIGLENGTVSYITADGFADAVQANVSLSPPSLGSKLVIAKRTAPAATIAIDAAQALPAITSSTLSGANSQRPVISWSPATAGTDGGLVRVRFLSAEDRFSTWTFVVPPGATTVTAPALPAEAANFVPMLNDAGADEVFEEPEILFLEADVLPSYALFRSQQGALIDPYTSFYDLSFPAVPLNGTYRAAIYTDVR
ncbi:MAG: hypothetical protein K0S65_242 [Labilithrix sp.]|nr:hypothetical protein [Labilithrix sp.]